jgi:tellurite resistance protein TehA-like permease
MAIIVGLTLWGLSIWFFIVSAGSLFEYLRPGRKLPFAMNWFSFVFPNAALVTATFTLGEALGSKGLQVFGCVMTGGLIVVFAFVFAQMLRSLWRRELLWPYDGH